MSLPPDVPVPLAEGGNLLHWREKLEGTATVDGDTLTGSVKAGAFGSFPMSGTRKA